MNLKKTSYSGLVYFLTDRIILDMGVSGSDQQKIEYVVDLLFQ